MSIQALALLRPELAEHIHAEPNTGCWMHSGRVDAWGYAYYQAKINGKKFGKAHRAVWTLLVGPIPPGMFLDHICRVKCCCNPDHLRVVTPQINARENSIGPAAKNLGKLACPKCGGPYTEYSRRNRESGVSRQCVPCRRAYKRQFYIDRPGFYRDRWLRRKAAMKTTQTTQANATD